MNESITQEAIEHIKLFTDEVKELSASILSKDHAVDIFVRETLIRRGLITEEARNDYILQLRDGIFPRIMVIYDPNGIKLYLNDGTKDGKLIGIMNAENE